MRQKGFTLIEVMLAMALTVLVGVIAYNSLSVSMIAADSNTTQAQRLADIQSALTLMERDIRQAALRSTVDQYGDTQPSLAGSSLLDYPLSLSRFGWDNPSKQKRGQVQRVRYRLQDKKLWREYWPVLDLIDEAQGMQSLMLLEGVLALNFRFLDDRGVGREQSPLGGEWKELWHPARDDDRLPRAVELRFDIENFGQVKRVIEVASQ
jgi:general secretion pathway protein J